MPRFRASTEKALAALEVAAGLLVERDGVGMLDALLEAWRAHPSLSMEQLVVAAGEALAPGDAGPQTLRPDERLLAFAERAATKRAGEVAWLMRDFAEARKQKTPDRLIVARLKRLGGFASDPRVSIALSRLNWNGPSDSLYDALERTFKVHPSRLAAAELGYPYDEDMLEVLGEPPDPPLELQERIDALRADLLEASPLSAKTAPHRKRESPDALMQRVWSNPLDDAARQVVADGLIEAGDPRGEFISLQLANAGGKGSVATLAREKALLGRHLGTLLGALAPFVVKKTCSFEKGFLASCVVKIGSKEALSQARLRPEWATVRRITFGNRRVFLADSFASLEALQLPANLLPDLARLVSRGLLSRLRELEFHELEPRQLDAKFGDELARGLPPAVSALSYQVHAARRLTLERDRFEAFLGALPPQVTDFSLTASGPFARLHRRTSRFDEAQLWLSCVRPRPYLTQEELLDLQRTLLGFFATRRLALLRIHWGSAVGERERPEFRGLFRAAATEVIEES